MVESIQAPFDPRSAADLRRAVFREAAFQDGPEPVLEVLCRELEKRLPDACCCATLLSASDQALRLAAAPSLPRPLREELAVVEPSGGTGLAQIAASSGNLEVSEDLASDPRWTRRRESLAAAGFRAAVSLPILAVHLAEPVDGEGTRVFGTLDVFVRRPGPPEPEALVMLEVGGAVASAVLHGLEARKRRFEERSFDRLTGLPNRRLFGVELDRALDGADPRRDRFVLLRLDLDHFRGLNETVGYAMGDKLLQETARRLAALRGPGDLLARLGDDDFAFLLSERGREVDAASWAEGVVGAVAEPHDFAGHALVVTASAGVSLFPWDGRDASTMSRNAEKALEAAKRKGRNCVELYTASLGTADFDALELKTSLHLALEEGELGVGFQPLVDARSESLRGVEALVHWNHPRRGRLPASRFIHLAEESGLSLELDQRVLRSSCAQAAGWRTADREPLHLSVNVSAHQFERAGFVGLVRDSVEASGLPDGSLVLEITERIASSNPARAAATLRELAALGVRVALDDVGTGYSSMAQLERFAIHWLKIDRSFVTGLPEHGENRAIVRAILAMARALGLEVVAEGVEEADQARFLADEGCDLLQGYRYGRAVESPEVERMLRDGTGPA